MPNQYMVGSLVPDGNVRVCARAPAGGSESSARRWCARKSARERVRVSARARACASNECASVGPQVRALSGLTGKQLTLSRSGDINLSIPL
jgi:hypothetical protein